MAEARICLGKIVGVHGVRGLVRIKSFTERPEDLVAYGPLGDKAGDRVFDVTLKGRAKGVLLAAVAGVGDRDRAKALQGAELYVERSALPALAEAEDEFYRADLIGLAAEDLQGRPLGRVRAVHNFGAGDVIELAGVPKGGPGGVPGGAPGGSLMVPFTKAAVPAVDLASGRLVVDPPGETGGETDDETEAGPQSEAGGSS